MTVGQYPWFVRGLFLILGIAIGSGAAAQECASSAGYPQAVQAVQQWQLQNGIGLTAEAEADILREFCDAAGQLAQDVGIGASAIGSGAAQAISGYLDESSSAAADTRSLSGHLAAQFGLGSGPALPGQRAMGRIRITYRQQADSLLVAGRRLPAYPVLLSRIGQVTVSGLLNGAPVCSGNVMVMPTVVAAFIC